MSDLHVKYLSKTYNHSKDNVGFSIQSISLQIQEGESFAILGPSGCGKTTLLKCIAGLLQPDEGMICLGNNNIGIVPAEKREFGMVFQHPLLFPHMTVIDNVAFGLKMQGWSKKERERASQEVLSAVGLTGYDGSYPNQLSGGQQQRVALARAIVIKPKLLLLDEPFSALDPGIRGEMRKLLKDIHKQYRISMLLVTHDQDEAFELADRLAVMNNGQILQIGSPMDVYKKPNHQFVASFLGTGNVIEGELQQGLFQLEDFQLDCKSVVNTTSGTGWLVIRPELFRLVTEEEAQISGILIDIKLRQGYYQLGVKIGDQTLYMLKSMKNNDILQIGSILYLDLDISQIHFIHK